MAMAMCRLDRVLVAVHHAVPPTNEEWQRGFDLIDGLPVGTGRALVDTNGPCGPSPSQRRELAVHVKRVGMRSAIFTDSIVLRGMVTALAWFGIGLRAFEPGNYRDAGNYLELSKAELASAIEAIARLRLECGMRPETRPARAE